MHFIYRGPGTDLAIAGDVIGARTEAPMTRVDGTDLFYYSTELAPDARVNYHFIRDYMEVTDPRNPRATVTEIYGADMELLFLTAPMPVSWMSMPGWEPPAHLVALGVRHFVVREKNRNFKRVTDPATITHILNAPEGRYESSIATSGHATPRRPRSRT